MTRMDMITEKEASNQCTLPEQDKTPFIKKEIGGTVYTVLIRFASTATETMQDKVKRMLQKDVMAECKG